MIWTDELIKELIGCSKKVVDFPRTTNKGERMGFIKKTFSFISADEKHVFNGFITQNEVFPENFSIGLTYVPKNEKGAVVLLRCNGRHGGTRQYPHHAHPHIHYASAERISLGLKAEGVIEITDKYATVENALEYFVNLINLDIRDRSKFVGNPGSIQIDLFS